MGAAQDLVNAGYIGYTGWGDDAALADFQATGGAGKEGGGGSSSGDSSTGFSFDQAGAERNALEELRPYYEKLLKIYNGDIALAKQRLEQDYERGLRYKAEDVDISKGEIADTRAERRRKFDIALGDIDQEMNRRGVYNSGIRNKERKNAELSENYQQKLLTNQEESLDRGLTRYKADSDIDMKRWYEEQGMIKPVEGTLTGPYAYKNAPTFTGAKVTDYVAEPEQFKTRQEEEKKQRAIEMALMKRTQAQNDWATNISKLNETAPTV